MGSDEWVDKLLCLICANLRRSVHQPSDPVVPQDSLFMRYRQHYKLDLVLEVFKVASLAQIYFVAIKCRPILFQFQHCSEMQKSYSESPLLVLGHATA